MHSKISTALAAASLAVTLALPLAAQAAPVAVTGGDGLLAGFDNLVVTGQSYSVRFVEGTFASVFGGVPQFALASQASAAAFALYNALALVPTVDASPWGMSGCGSAFTEACFVLTADAEFSSLPDDVDAIAVRNGQESVSVLNGMEALTMATNFDTHTDNIGPGGVSSYVWAKWELTSTGGTVPEPTGLALLATAGAGALAASRRRKPAPKAATRS